MKHLRNEVIRPCLVFYQVRSEVPVARLETVLEGGKAGAVCRDVALGPMVGNVVSVSMMERPQVFQCVRCASRDVDDLPAKIGVGLAVIGTADPGATFVLAPHTGVNFVAAPAFLPYLLNELFAVVHVALLVEA